MEEKGVIYLALNKLTFMQMCMLSMTSLRSTGYAGPIVVVSNLPRELWYGTGELGYSVICPDGWRADGRQFKLWKTRLDRVSPFRDTLFLDCDTIVRKPIDGIWRFVDDPQRPIAMALDRMATVRAVRRAFPRWGAAEDWEETIRLCGWEAAHFNSGVICWRKSEPASRLFGIWERELDKRCDTDQVPLIRAIHLVGLPPIELSTSYNAQTGDSRNCVDPIIRHLSGIDSQRALTHMFGEYLRLWEADRPPPSVWEAEAPAFDGHGNDSVFCTKFVKGGLCALHEQ